MPYLLLMLTIVGGLFTACPRPDFHYATAAVGVLAADGEVEQFVPKLFTASS